MKSNEIKLIIFYHFSQTVCAWELLHQDWIADWIAADCFGQPALPQYAPDHAQQSAEGSAPKSVGRTHLLAELALRIGMQWRPVGWVKGGGVWLRVPAFEPPDSSRWPLFIAAHGTDHDLGSKRNAGEWQHFIEVADIRRLWFSPFDAPAPPTLRHFWLSLLYMPTAPSWKCWPEIPARPATICATLLTAHWLTGGKYSLLYQ